MTDDMPGQRELLNICFSCLRYSRIGASGALPLVRPANFNNVFLRGGTSCSQCRFSSSGQGPETAKKPEDAGIESNPFYDKYKEKLKHLATSDPDEFQSRLEQFAESKKPKRATPPPSATPGQPDTGAAPRAAPQPISRTASYTMSKGLDSVMKLELIQDKSPAEIELLWKDYHATKDCVFACLKKEDFEDLLSKGQSCPTFILPLIRDDGYEFILMQFDGKDVQFTSLALYQVLKENAPACMSLVHYTELMDTKGLVLMNGQYDDKVLKREDAVMIVQMMTIYYGKNSPRFDRVETFNHQPDKFDFNVLIEDYNSMYLDRPIRIKTG